MQDASRYYPIVRGLFFVYAAYALVAISFVLYYFGVAARVYAPK